MAEKMSCPFCGTQVEYAIENSPDWYRDPSLPVYRIDCHDKCRQYWLEGISDPYPQIDPSILAFLNSLDGEQRTFISESTRHACDNGYLIVCDRPRPEGRGFRNLIRKHLWNSESDWRIQRSSRQSC